jgi:glycosyltransferase involved in cell wall biosynthesis
VRILLVDPRGETRPYDDALAAALVGRGHEVTLATAASRGAPVAGAPSVRVRRAYYRLADRLPAGRARRVARGVEHVADLAALVPCLLRRRPDAIHLQWLPLAAVDRPFWAGLGRILGVPVVLTAHDAAPNEPTPARRRRFAANARAFARVIVHSEHGRGVLVGDYGVDPARVRVIPHGALVAYREVVPVPPAVPPGAPVVALVGLLRPYKGLDVLLDAWPSVRAAVPDAVLLVMGRVLGDPAVERLGALARDGGSGVVADLRFVGDDEFAGALARAEVVALPYRRIDQSGVLFAALALGRPIVASRVGGFAEVVEAHGAGAVVPPGDADALAEALIAMLRDPERRAACAEAARVAADGPFSWDAIAAATEAAYGEGRSG